MVNGAGGTTMLKRLVSKFWHDKRGYVIALTLIAMPLLLGFSLLVIDASRGENLHTDLQDAVDAMALAGARKLDGTDNAIAHAEEAMEALDNRAAFGTSGGSKSLGSEVSVSYFADNSAKSTVNVYFLSGIPADDDSTDWNSVNTIVDKYGVDPSTTAGSNAAAYVWVIAKPQAMKTIFPIPVSLTRDTIDISAQAVAVFRSSACDIAPIFICNPFEDEGKSISDAFGEGDFHGALISMHLPANVGDPAGPGNFGFLDVDGMDALDATGGGASALKKYFAGNGAPICIKQDSTVTTKPGKTTSVERAINTRFDMLEGGAVPGNFDPGPPAINVRKGIQPTGKGGGSSTPKCDLKPTLSIDPVADKTTGFPDDQNYLINNPTSGARVGKGDWNGNFYWQTNYGTAMPSIPSSFPGKPPSRYDVYQYEIANGTYDTVSPGGESGAALCYKKDNADADPPSFPDRRIIVAAMVNCAAAGAINGKKSIPVSAFAKVFLTRPVKTANNVAKSTGSATEVPYQLEFHRCRGRRHFRAARARIAR